MYHENFFCPFLPMFSIFDGKMVNVVENAECFSSWLFFCSKIRFANIIWMTMEEGVEKQWKIITDIKLHYAKKNMQRVSSMECSKYKFEKNGFITFEEMKSNIEHFEQQLNVTANYTIIDNITDEALEIAAKMFISLNQCPTYLYGWQFLYSELLNKSPPDIIILTLNRIIKGAKSKRDVKAQIAKSILGRITNLLSLKYEHILNLNLPNRNFGNENLDDIYGK